MVRVSREFRFEAAHRLEDSAGKCEALHGHTWCLRVTVEAPVGPDGIAFDFFRIEEEVRRHVLSRIDHTYLNDVCRPPSAENVARWAWDALAHLPLAEIRVGETPECFVAYDGREGPA
jgi:6-pyruvoyltetrahydropterin/6-carboxytetrahydropterin synthase